MQQRLGVLAPLQAALRGEPGLGSAEALVPAQALFGKGFAHPCAGVGVGLLSHRFGAPGRLLQDGGAAPGAVGFDQIEQGLGRLACGQGGARRFGRHASSPS